MLILRRLIFSLFIVQVLTGLLLMTVYSPSTATAWGSTWYIQAQVPCGWLIRSLHHFASDALIIVLLLYAGQLVVTKGYRTPHRSLWWTALFALGLVLGLSLTGHLLPWDQEGYWGTKVRTNILARTPLIGEMMAKMLIGGAEFGNLTLTRFYTLHVAILPLAMGWLIVLVRKRREERLDADQGAAQERSVSGVLSVANAVVLFTVLLVLLATAWYVRTTLGSELLDAPADPTGADYPARPEWHTLFLYQWLKAFEGPVLEVVGAIVIPSAIVLAFFLLPFAERVFTPRASHRMAMGLTTIVVLSAIGLTVAAKLDDCDPGESKVAAIRAKQASGAVLNESDEAALRARQFNLLRDQRAREAKRAMELAESQGIPPEGPSVLLGRDALTAGPKLFATHCATCHRYDGHDGRGNVPLETATSSDLARFASREWVRGLLANPMDDHYFGRMRTPEGEPAHTRMSKFVAEIMPEGEEARRSLLADFDAVAVFLSSESSPSSAVAPAIGRGMEVFMNVCNECHSYDGERKGTTHAPEMKDYGSVEWIELMIAEPDHESRYRATGRERARMPSFKDKLNERERNMIAQWLHYSRETGGLSD